VFSPVPSLLLLRSFSPLFLFFSSPCPALGLQPTADHYVGKLSATGQPTRPTQPFILPRSINE